MAVEHLIACAQGCPCLPRHVSRAMSPAPCPRAKRHFVSMMLRPTASACDAGPVAAPAERPSRVRLLKPAACFFAQLHLLHLPRTRHGQFLDEHDVARDLVACDLAAAVLDDLGCGEFVSW